MPLNIGLFGCGTIGSYVAECLLSEKFPDLQLKRILVSNLSKQRPFDNHLFTTDPSDIINDPDIDLVVEVLGNEEPALSYIQKAIQQNKHIVTANKELIAKHGPQIFELAEKHNVHVKMEASVAGGIPILNTITNNLQANEITQINGILNGTTNYILTQMESGQEFSYALKQAQELGYAEPDPTNDIEGFDAQYKISILASLAFGKYISPQYITCTGISEISQIDFKIAQSLGYSIKLLGTTHKHSDGLEVEVMPHLIDIQHPLTSIKDVLNSVSITTNLTNEILLSGAGAGAAPTTSSILNDILCIQSQASLPFVAPYTSQISPNDIIEQPAQYYIRLEAFDQTGVMGDIGKCLANDNVNIASIIQEPINNNLSNICLITHQISSSQLSQSLNNLSSQGFIKQICCTMKIMNASS